MILFFLLLIDPPSFRHPRGRVVLFRGITPLCLVRDGRPRLGAALRLCKTHQSFMQRTVIGSAL
ncbi:MAG TPA: hypothetical protein VHS97_00840, partial [Isosphaeraceae bacterium]|nr:hypothetical protein [Isosphaeraceae bacterium]